MPWPVKMMGDKYTRDFRNYHHATVSEEDFGGARSMLDNRYKLVVGAQSGKPSAMELFDLKNDPAEERNLIGSHTAIAERMERQLRDWQQSVLESLTGADYR